MIRIVLIDDHEILRGGLAELLGREPSIEVVGQSSNASDGLAKIEELSPDVITLDLSMPGQSGRELAIQLLAREQRPKIVILSSEVDADNVKNLVQLGVEAYVSKSAPSADVVRAIQSVMTGQNYFSPDVMTVLMSSGSQGAPKLTLRQMEVLSAAATGLTTKEIADKLHVSPKTVEKYRGEIISRLDSRNLVEAINKARQHKLID